MEFATLIMDIGNSTMQHIHFEIVPVRQEPKNTSATVPCNTFISKSFPFGKSPKHIGNSTMQHIHFEIVPVRQEPKTHRQQYHATHSFRNRSRSARAQNTTSATVPCNTFFSKSFPFGKSPKHRQQYHATHSFRNRSRSARAQNTMNTLRQRTTAARRLRPRGSKLRNRREAV